MYPQEELKRLARTRALLHRRIAAQRERIGKAADGVAAPVHLAEEAWGRWKRLSPLLKLFLVPAGWWVRRRGSGGWSLLRQILPFIPDLLSFLRSRRRAA